MRNLPTSPLGQPAPLFLALLLMSVTALVSSSSSIPPDLQLPSKFQVSFYATDTQSSPLEYLGNLVTIAVSGDRLGISLPDKNSSVYYSLNCSAEDAQVGSYQVSYFNIWQSAIVTPFGPQRQCWYPLPGNQVNEGEWVKYREIVRAFMSPNPRWDYGGTLTNRPKTIKVWSRAASPSARTTIGIDASTGAPYELVTSYRRVNYVWQFVDGSFTMYGDDEEVPGAVPSALDLEKCLPMSDVGYNDSPCPAAAAASKRRSMAEDNSGYTPDWQMLEDVLKAVRTGLIPNKGANIFEEDYRMVAKNTTLFPPRHWLRAALPDLRNQRTCGACWAFSTAVTLSSAYSAATKQHFTFSPQYIMDCTPKKLVTDQGGTGCWGGSQTSGMDFLIAQGSVLPLDLDYRYAGVQGLCDLNATGVAMNLTSYASPRTNREIKDAISYRGALSISLSANDAFDAWSSYGASLVPAGKLSYDPLSYLTNGNAKGLSCHPKDAYKINHAVNLVGWTTCKVTNGTMHLIQGECWIVQNTWGSDAGFNGFWLINSDRSHDCGISLEPLIPMFF